MTMALEKFQEDPTEIPTGFLTQIWNEQEELPRDVGAAQVLAELERGVKTFTALPFPSIAASIASAAAVFLVVGLMVLLSNIDTFLSATGSTLDISAYLKDDAADDAVAKLVRELKSDSRVASVTVLSKSEALKNFRAELGSRAGFLEGLEDQNPLPASLEIVVRAGASERDDATAIVNRLRRDATINDLTYGTELVERARQILQGFRWGAMFIGVLVFAVMAFLIGSTLRLVLYSRKTEIEIMQLVGADDWFIRRPFIIAGALQGLTGGIVGVVLLWLCGGFLSRNLASFPLLAVQGTVFENLSFAGAFLTVIVSSTIGAFASFLSVGRHLDA